MITFVEALGLLMCSVGFLVWLLYEIQRGIDTYDDD